MCYYGVVVKLVDCYCDCEYDVVCFVFGFCDEFGVDYQQCVLVEYCVFYQEGDGVE